MVSEHKINDFPVVDATLNWECPSCLRFNLDTNAVFKFFLHWCICLFCGKRVLVRIAAQDKD